MNPLPVIGLSIHLLVGLLALMVATEPGATTGEFINGRGCAVFLLWFSALVGGLFGLGGLAWIRTKPGEWKGRVPAWFCVFIAGAYYLGSGFIPIRDPAYNASAQSAGRNVKLAEEVYYNDRGKGDECYTSNFDLLLQVDRNLTIDRKVTFVFLHASQSGFTLYTEHAKGKGKTFTYTD